MVFRIESCSFYTNEDLRIERKGIPIKEKKKMGRPTDNPKPYRVGFRLDEESKAILDDYCREKDVSISEAGNIAIKKLKEDLGDE